MLVTGNAVYRGLDCATLSMPPSLLSAMVVQDFSSVGYSAGRFDAATAGAFRSALERLCA